ncbi:serine/threonine-protein phosphatase with EF-hands 2-like [Liolophura sinensis]|uniref:serine/threonine-protein phosphatase with EF-hands 2-like n=1 Tax=Liolophura sinensis TaxID=3198878 RepID=UPI003158675F
MGCGLSSGGSSEMKKSEKAMKSAILIQRWYRQYRARLEARRRYTWNIFQSIEYAGEQNQLKLYNFFTEMLVHLSPGAGGESKLVNAFSLTCRKPSVCKQDSLALEDEELLDLTDPKPIEIEPSYSGPHIEFPLTQAHIQRLIAAFKKKQLLHAKYLLQLLHEARKRLKLLKNISHASSSIAKQVTVCGDLHGKLDDLIMVFYKNGLPAVDNPYVFNGDFVDRGPSSVEVSSVLFACFLVNPNEVYLNRGNHEDHIMNLRYGFIKEIMGKYKRHATKIIKLFEDVFSWLPLATLIDSKVLVAHGGISDKIDLEYLAKIDRHKYLSALRPPVTETFSHASSNEIDLVEWRQILDILWSDPRHQKGCKPNTFRGGGSYFGPDITEQILTKHNLQLLIRSHECKPDGYEYTHNGKVLTIFSASNYYEIGSNKGAYVKLQEPDLQPHIVQYMASRRIEKRKITLTERISMVEASALRDLREKIISSKSELMKQFESYDEEKTGKIHSSVWCSCMENILEMDLPWRTLRTKLVKSDTNHNMVIYETTFEQFKIQHKFTENGPTVTETLYKNKDSLETIFRLIDKDNSGYITMDEFSDACSILSQHIGLPIKKEEVADLARSIDINKDGKIDFNEFLEAFRLVDMEGKEVKILGDSPIKMDSTLSQYDLHRDGTKDLHEVESNQTDEKPDKQVSNVSSKSVTSKGSDY